MTDSDRNQEERERSKRIDDKKIMEDLGLNNSLINQLPDDCLKHIFSFLPILERLEAEKVCKRWRLIGERGWNDIEELTIDQEYSDNTVYLALKRCGRFLRILEVYAAPEHSYPLSMIIKFCKLDQLEDITINLLDGERYDEFFIRNLREILGKARKLVAVTIAGFQIGNEIDCLNVLNPETLQKLCLTDTDFPAYGEQEQINPDKFPNLKELDLTGVEIFQDERKIEEESLKGLESLKLSDCQTPQNFIQRIATFSNLQELMLYDNFCVLEKEHIRDIARHCVKLTALRILDCFSMTTDCFQYLGEMLSLEILRLGCFENIRSRDFMHLVNVKHLDVIFHMDTHRPLLNALIGLIKNSSNLETMRLSFSSYMDIAFVNNVRQLFHRGQREKHLKLTISLRNTQRLPDDTQMLPDHPLLNVAYISY